MKRIVITKPGGYERLTIQNVPDLDPEVGQVVVNVEVVGANYADCIVRMGLYSSAKKYVGYPITPGFEFAGHVAKVGSAAGFQIGQPVFGVSLFNSYASQVAVPAHQVWPLPDGLSMAQAATFPVAFLTGWYAALKLGQASSGMNALVHSAAGGVGSALVQILKLCGCRVLGVVGKADKVEVARSMGCDVVVDKGSEPLWTKAEEFAPHGFDLIFDATGPATLKAGYRHLAPMGKLVTYGFHSMLPRTGGRPNILKLAWDYWRMPRFNPLRMTDANKSIMAFNLSYLFQQRAVLDEGIHQIFTWLQEKRIRPLPVTEFDWHHVAEVHRQLESGRTVGRLALVNWQREK